MLCTSAYIHAKFKLKPKLGSNSQLTLAFHEQNLAIRSSPLTFFGDLFDDQLRTPQMGGPNPSVGSSDPSTMQQYATAWRVSILSSEFHSPNSTKNG
jgi:hypothetical protein